MNEEIASPVASGKSGRFDWLHIVLIVVLTVIVAIAATVWIVRTYVFPTEFEPVALNNKEAQVLERKLESLDRYGAPPRLRQQHRPADAAGEQLEPEPYREDAARREIVFTEKELNAMLANNTDLARKLAIDLSDDLLSAKLLVPMEPDFPILGGKTVKVRAGLELAYRAGRPIVVLRGVSVMGVPLPNAWIGGIKNIDLVQEFGTEGGFWKAFSDGVEHIEVKEGRLRVKLKP